MAFRQIQSVGVLIATFRSSIPSPPIPLLTLRRAPRDAQRKTRGRAGRYPFLVRLLHSLLHAGLSGARIDVFCFNYDPSFGPMAGSMAENNQSYDLVGKPAFMWYEVTAQADSAWSGSPPFYGQADFPTQAARGTHYATVDIPNFLNAKGRNGDYYVVGFNWWELTDSGPGEHANEGFISNKDNAYNGQEAVIARGTDPWGFPTGGEAANYGDFLNSVRSANLNVLRSLIAEHYPH